MSSNISNSKLASIIELGVKRGMADIDAGRFRELTPKYANGLASRFKKQLQSTK